MSAGQPNLKRHAAAIVTVIALIAVTGFCQLPQLPSANDKELAQTFHFKKQVLPLTADHPEFRFVRQVHPSLQRVSAWMSAMGAAVTLADLDGDGLPNDSILVDTRTDLVTVAPVPGSAERYKPFALSPAPLKYDANTAAPMGTLAGDFNEDGLQDILVYFWGRPPIIYLKKQNESSLSLSNYKPVELAPQLEQWNTSAVAYADLDGDGHQDLVIGNYFPDGSRVLDAKADGTITMMNSNSHACNGGHKHFFLWKDAKPGESPDVHFQEVTGVLGEEVSCGWTLAMGACDLDGDNKPELYIANDVGPDRLLQNKSTPGHLQLEPVHGTGGFISPTAFVLGEDPFKGMGVDFADINGDGTPDIYVSNIAQPYGLQESHFLFLSQPAEARGNNSNEFFKNGIAPYKQASENLGLSRAGWAWDCRLADFDNDGKYEAVQAKGFVKGNTNRWPEAQSLATCNNAMLTNPMNWPSFKPGADISGDNPDSFYVQAKDGRFYDLAAELGVDDRLLGRGIAVADVDGDGKLDFAIANQFNDSYYFHNESPAKNNFLSLHLTLPLASDAADLKDVQQGHPQAGHPYLPAIGARAIVQLPDGRKLVGQVDGGSGHSGKRSTDLHFGLGDLSNDKDLKVELFWRDRQGQSQSKSISLKPGTYTVRLVSAKGAAPQS